MPDSAYDLLNEAGLQRLPEAQRQVFESLSPDELRVVNGIQERLNGAAPEIQGQGDVFNTVC